VKRTPVRLRSVEQNQTPVRPATVMNTEVATDILSCQNILVADRTRSNQYARDV
jgi:hypothetical protein